MPDTVNTFKKEECPACGASDYVGELKECPYCHGMKCSKCDMGKGVGCVACDNDEEED